MVKHASASDIAVTSKTILLAVVMVSFFFFVSDCFTSFLPMSGSILWQEERIMSTEGRGEVSNEGAEPGSKEMRADEDGQSHRNESRSASLFFRSQVQPRQISSRRLQFGRIEEIMTSIWSHGFRSRSLETVLDRCKRKNCN